MGVTISLGIWPDANYRYCYRGKTLQVTLFPEKFDYFVANSFYVIVFMGKFHCVTVILEKKDLLRFSRKIYVLILFSRKIMTCYFFRGFSCPVALFRTDRQNRGGLGVENF